MVALIAPNRSYALNPCTVLHIEFISPSPIYTTNTKEVTVAISGTGLEDGSTYSIRVDCGLLLADPKSDFPTFNSSTSTNVVFKLAYNGDLASCQTSGTPPISRSIVFRKGGRVGNAEICSFPDAFTIEKESLSCHLTTNPQVVRPGNSITVTSNDFPTSIKDLMLRYIMNSSYSESRGVARNGETSFSESFVAPSQEGIYSVDLVSFSNQANIICSQQFQVQLNAPPGATMPPQAPDGSQPADRCGGAKDPTACHKCLGTNFENSGSYSWTAIGCIPTQPDLFIKGLLPGVIGMAGGIAFLLMLYGVFTIIMSTGNPEKINQGKEIIVSALVGLIMILFSVFLLKLIGVDILGIPGFKR